MKNKWISDYIIPAIVVSVLTGLLFTAALLLIRNIQQSEPIRTQNVVDEIRVIDVNYEEEYTSTSFINSGKTIIPISQYHEAVYEVTFDYDGIEFTVDDEEVYKKAKDKKYELIECELELNYYKNNSYKINLVKVK